MMGDYLGSDFSQANSDLECFVYVFNRHSDRWGLTRWQFDIPHYVVLFLRNLWKSDSIPQ